MPNHVTNIIQLQGEDEKIAKLLEKIKNDKLGIGSIDFNKLIPMPESLNIEAGSRTDRGFKAYRDFMGEYISTCDLNYLNVEKIPTEAEQAYLKSHKDIRRDEWELGRQAYVNMVKYKAPTWHEWCTRHWETKWNAYGMEGAEIDKNTIFFQTAWNPPHIILRKMTEMFPDVTIDHKWADEDIGHNCGEHVYECGERISEYYPQTEKEALEFAAEILDVDLADYDLVISVDKSKYVNLNDEYELIELFGKPALFSDSRLFDSNTPQGMYCYHFRTADYGYELCTVEPEVMVNHGGSVIMNEPLDFGKDGYIELPDDFSLHYLGKNVTLGEFVSMTPEDITFDGNEPKMKI